MYSPFNVLLDLINEYLLRLYLKFDNWNIEYSAKENLAGADLSYFQS